MEVNHDVAFVAGFRNLHACHSGSVQHFKEAFLVGVSHLHHHAGILGEEDAHEVCVAELGEIYVQTAFHTSEAHFQETGDETTGGDVVTCQEKTFLNKLLHGVEGIAEIIGRSHASHVISHFSLRLSKGRTAKCQRRGGEVNVIEAALRHVLQDGIHHFADVVHLAAGADDDGARRDNLLAVGILLREGERVFSGRNVNLQFTAEAAEGFDGSIEAGVLTLLGTAGPHPVGGEGDGVKTIAQGGEDKVGQGFGDGEAASLRGVSETCLRGMTDGGGDAGATTIVQSDAAIVRQGELEFALRLLVGDTSGDGTVHLVREPVFASNCFKTEHVLHIFLKFGGIRLRSSIVTLHGGVGHDGLGGVAEHLRHFKVEGTFAVSLLEAEAGVAGGFADDIERSTLTLGDAAHVVDVFLANEESHAFLAFVGDDFLGGKRRVADGQGTHVNLTATLFHEFAEAVHVAGGAVVVDAHHGVHVFFAKRTNEVGGAFLHFGVGALHGVEFDGAGIASRIYGRNGTAAESDAIVVTADNNDLVAFLRFALEAVATSAVADTARQHDDLVVAILLSVLLMLKGEERAGDEGLSELVAEVGSTVGGFDENLLGRLIEPLSHGQDVLPATSFFKARIGSHIDCRSRDGEASRSTTHAVTDFAAGAGAGAVEGFDGGGEVVGFGFERNHALHVFHSEPVGHAVLGRGEHLDGGTLGEGYVVFIG